MGRSMKESYLSITNNHFFFYGGALSSVHCHSSVRRRIFMISSALVLRLCTRIQLTVMVLTALAGLAASEPYPSRPIMLTVSTTAGASPDLIARLFAQQLSDGMRVPVVVENKGGANGQIAAQATASASPDGYSLLATTGATLTINPALYPAAKVAATRLAPVTQLAHQDFVITTRPSSNVRTLSELLEWSRKNPGKLNVATTAFGSLAYLTAQLLKQAVGIEFVTIPHNGGEQAVAAVLGNNADVLVETITLSRPYIESGKLVPVAVTAPKRSAFLPGVPTLIESNVDVQTRGWTAIVVPKSTATDIVLRVREVLSRGLQSSPLKKKLDEMCAEPIVNTPEDFEREWKQEEQMWASVIKKAGIKLE
jgi:tripartite-type tricarboxylate transporter receptor subunit TctC